MVNAFQKFSLLFWKNLLIQNRHKVQTTYEVLIPVLFSALILVIRSLVESNLIADPTIYPSFSPQFVPPLNLSFRVNFTVPPLTDSLLEGVVCPGLELIPDTPGPAFLQQGGNGRDGAARVDDVLKLNKWFVLYSPKSPVVKKIMDKAKETAGVLACEIENAELLNAILMAPVNFTSSVLLAGIVFPDELSNKKELPHNVDISLRFPGVTRYIPDIPCDDTGTPDSSSALERNWFTQLRFPLYQTPGPRNSDSNCTGPPGYFSQGFLGLQSAVLSSIYDYERTASGKNWPNFDVKMNRFPFPSYYDDKLLQAMEQFVPIMIMISFVYTAIGTVRMVTLEKEKQLKEAMKMMGLSSWLHWTAWFVRALILYTISIALIIVLLQAPIIRDKFVLRYSEWSCVLAFMFTYALSCVTLCFVISVFFSKASTAAVVTGLLWMLCYFPFILMQQQYVESSLGTKLAASLLSNTAMGFGFQLILMYEGTGIGLQWSNLWTPVSLDDQLTMGHVMGFLLIDSIIYMCIAVYVEAVFPGEYGVPQPWYFPFTKSYWMGTKGSHYVEDDVNSNDFTRSDLYEKEPRHLPAGIQIRNLRKVYGKKVAVDNLTLNMFEGQITVLLGHNGAGKTTTMSMLTGLYTPTSGTALVGGHSIRNDINRVRETLGLCPQHNVLFDELTVKQHLQFFGKLKGLTDKELDAEVTRFLKLLKLEDKTNTQSKALSGGMQRKLAAAVALCGRSKVVLFDEPTSGMDPSARRALWDLLEAEKEGRTILLTTHFMDEADILGDRIAIMSEGKLQCCGSSFFLKKKFGGGYHVVMVKESDCDVSKVTKLLKTFIPDLEVETNIGSELSYLLEEKYAQEFETIFRALEERKDELGISSFGVSLTSMEEVFMKVGSDAEKEVSDDTEEILLEDSVVPLHIEHVPLLSGQQLLWNQIVAMFAKYATSTARAWLLYVIVIIIPILDLTVSTLVGQNIQGAKDLPPRTITFMDFPHGIATVAHQNATSELEKLTKVYNKLIERDGGQVNLLNDMTGGSDVSGFILDHAETNVGVTSQTYILGTLFHRIDDQNFEVTGWFNNQPYHVPPIALNYIYNAILRYYVDQEYFVNFINHPLNYTESTKLMLQQAGNSQGFQLAFNTGFSFSFIMAFFIVFYIKERASKAKLLQFVSGVNTYIYWTTAYIWDLISSIGPLLGIIIVLAAFQQESFRTAEELGRVFLVLICAVFASLPFVYLSSFSIDVPAMGFSRIVVFNVFTGIAGYIVVMVLKTPSLNLLDTAEILDWVFTSFSPTYSLTTAVQNFNTNYLMIKTCKPIVEQYCSRDGAVSICCRDEAHCPESGCMYWTEDYFDWKPPGAGRYLAFFFIDAVIYYYLLILSEYKVGSNINWLFWKKAKKEERTEEETDSDVMAEKEKIKNVSAHDRAKYNLLLQGVTKYYKNFLAVHNLTLGVQEGECFGLLGVNGAGKTTTFKMLTGDETISSGDAFLKGLSLKNEMKEVNKLTGYCPQFDAVLEDLTGREVLRLFCRLRGVRNEEITYVSEKLAKDLLFFKHIDKKVKEYSGGNKRKLSTAVALIGDPPVVYLDEPTTGMDPVAKRHLWNVICRVRAEGKTIILTSHSMEECEALCTRLAIMVNGEFKCLGSTQHLKNKFAQGYTLTLKTKKANAGQSEDSLDAEAQHFKQRIEALFPGAVLKEAYQELFTFQLQPNMMPWSHMFGVLEKVKEELSIEDYSLGQTSLEQVFLSFTKLQKNTNQD